MSDRLDVTCSTVLRVTTKICEAVVNNITPHFNHWRTGERLQQVVEGFNQHNGLPRSIGAIDGTHIPIKAPKQHREHYINRKGFHSMQLQVVCDKDMKFTGVYCGWPGAAHDARVLRNSPLFHDAEARTGDLFPGQTYIIGNRAYPLRTWLLTGQRPPHCTANTFYSSFELQANNCRLSIGLLKGGLRKLAKSHC